MVIIRRAKESDHRRTTAEEGIQQPEEYHSNKVLSRFIGNYLM